MDLSHYKCRVFEPCHYNSSYIVGAITILAEFESCHYVRLTPLWAHVRAYGAIRICVWTVLPSTEWIRPPPPFLCSQPHHSRLHPPCPIPRSTASAASFTGGRLAGARSFGKAVPAVVFSGGRDFFVLCGDGERLIIHIDLGLATSLGSSAQNAESR